MADWYSAQEYAAVQADYDRARVEIDAARRLAAAAAMVTRMMAASLPAKGQVAVDTAALVVLTNALADYQQVRS